MKIALNIEYVGVRRGGAEKYAGTLARALAAEGHSVDVFAREVDPGELPPGARFHPVRPRRIPGLGALRTYRFALESQEAMEGHRFDRIIGFSKVWYQDVYLAVGGSHPATLDYSSRRFRRWLPRWLWWLGKYANLKQWVFRAIARRQFSSRFTPHVIAPSRMVAEHFRRYHGISPERISVVYNGLDLHDWPEDRGALREAFRRQQGFAADEVLILFAAHNYSLKGLTPLLEAFAPVARRFPESQLVVCGSRRDHGYRRRARSLGIESQVRFLGFVKGIWSCFAGADVFAFPTFYDPCSLVVPEAMAAGLPVVTTRQNGAGELLTEGEDGFLVDSPWHLEQIGDCLARLVGDAELRRAIGARAASRARQLTIDAQIERLLAVLEGEIGPSRPAKWRDAA